MTKGRETIGKAQSHKNFSEVICTSKLDKVCKVLTESLPMLIKFKLKKSL